jgi:hypothetical protein
MRTLKLYLYESLTAFILLGIAHVLLVDQRLLLVGKGMLVALFAMVAIATEAVVASNLRPEIWQVLTSNLLVTGAVFASGWSSLASLRISAIIATATLILRLLVAITSLRVSRAMVRRFAAGLIGGTLLLETLFTAYSSCRSMYYDYYLYPMVKDRYVMPLRWQDIVSLVVYWFGAIALSYVSYRLLKYPLRHQSPMTT